MYLRFLMLVCFFNAASNSANAQYPGPVGSSSSTAIHKDSSIFVAWANQCSFVAGPTDISNPDAPLVNTGSTDFVLGPADGAGILSLGDGGSATLGFAQAITDGPGFDFVVFENAFTAGFLELAFVEVSSDGEHFFRFDAISLTQDSTQIGPFDAVLETEKINNLAGKYIVDYGTPFDLSELEDNSLLDKNSITHVKVIDVVGSINPDFASYDSMGNPINDPFPTPFSSSGFDLDALGVINQLVSSNELRDLASFGLFPNPVQDQLHIFIDETSKPFVSELHYQIVSIDGSVEQSGSLNESLSLEVDGLEAGVYILHLFSSGDYVQYLRFVRL